MSHFEQTYCSQCGREFGPGDGGYSHCADHESRDTLQMLQASALATAAENLAKASAPHAPAPVQVPEGWPDALNLAPMPQSADPSAEIEAVQRDAWISVEHEMPKPYTDVLIAISTGKVLLASYFSQAGWDWAETDDAADMDAVVTHWMPLPPAPIAAAPQKGEASTSGGRDL